MYVKGECELRQSATMSYFSQIRITRIAYGSCPIAKCGNVMRRWPQTLENFGYILCVFSLSLSFSHSRSHSLVKNTTYSHMTKWVSKIACFGTNSLHAWVTVRTSNLTIKRKTNSTREIFFSEEMEHANKLPRVKIEWKIELLHVYQRSTNFEWISKVSAITSVKFTAPSLDASGRRRRFKQSVKGITGHKFSLLNR